jgi:hypothetical protein
MDFVGGRFRLKQDVQIEGIVRRNSYYWFYVVFAEKVSPNFGVSCVVLLRVVVDLVSQI